MTSKAKIIFHIDMNCFYASVEQALDVTLKNKPVAVAGNPKERRGILVTCSYEARAQGVYTTMSVWEAKRQCPELILLPPNFEKYREASKAMFDVLRTYTHLVEPVSIDEGYIDVTEIVDGAEAIELAQAIQQRLQSELDLPSSIGIAPNKFLAKTASDMKKPMGITILRKREVPKVLWPLPTINMHGVGESTAKKLQALGINTIGDIARKSEYELKLALGKSGVRLWQKSQGIDDRQVDPDSIYDTKSVGNSMTAPDDLVDIKEVHKMVEALCGKVASRLRSKHLVGTTLQLQMRTADWKNITRSVSFKNGIYHYDDLVRESYKLVSKHWHYEPLRLMGITVSHVYDRRQEAQQLSLFDYEEHVKDEPIIKLLDKIKAKFGENSIQKGVFTQRKSNFESTTSFSKDFLDDHRKEN
ncbi:DNA polymerase IV [Kurthia sibirica]|uniref:DNA polymerase IV n=1 Tax=Kurthia sibirica TaxID=202750 RepID=A0A2U3ALQ7_9BACL|nr:DNA polymerase IV [Kurthia sibirica]PWI25473.1 DNA polymerase IV [Kurthia sibirica]GEK33950.1 DNA polymerase IV 1 [Kurthia sibirica]